MSVPGLVRPDLLRDAALIDGRWCAADGGERIEVVDPATRSAVGSVPAMGSIEAEHAVSAASAALPAWRARTAAVITGDQIALKVTTRTSR